MKFLGHIFCFSLVAGTFVMAFLLFYKLPYNNNNLVRTTGTVEELVQNQYKCCYTSPKRDDRTCGCELSTTPKCIDLYRNKTEGTCCEKRSCCEKFGRYSCDSMSKYSKTHVSCRNCNQFAIHFSYEIPGEDSGSFTEEKECMFNGNCHDTIKEKYSSGTKFDFWLDPKNPPKNMEDIQTVYKHERPLLGASFIVPVFISICYCTTWMKYRKYVEPLEVKKKEKKERCIGFSRCMKKVGQKSQSVIKMLTFPDNIEMLMQWARRRRERQVVVQPPDHHEIRQPTAPPRIAVLVNSFVFQPGQPSAPLPPPPIKGPNMV